ncbi:MAG: 30S ribosomal protein S12 methylthiotransferase RimO [Deltaproteobacteria bacterium]|nr:30S ribosomal protein S12 methylthiotransferase RimO [Deltaproteobacteria bacterium]
MSQKVYLETLGCPKNLVDSEIMIGSFLTKGYTVTTDKTEADVIVVNTCGFLEASSKESIESVVSLGQTKKEGAKLVVAGCLVQRYGKELSPELPEADLLIGTNDYAEIANLLSQSLPEREYLHEPLYIPTAAMPRLLTDRVSTYVKIAEGCNHTCSFCIIPKLRGRQRSRSIADIRQEVENLLAQGVKEISLIAQDTTDYGNDLHNGTTIEKLLRSLGEIPGDHWMRLLYAYPLRWTDELIEIFRDTPTICKYLDIPFQHISDRLLQSMHRGSNSRYIWSIIERLRKEIPQMTIRSTFIVGYPGETEKDHKELEKFLQSAELERVGIFTYSQEEGTEAASLPDQLAKPLKEERRASLMELQQKISLKKNKALIGKKMKAIREKNHARLESQAPEIDGIVKLTGKGAINHAPTKNPFMTVKITDAGPYDLTGNLA